MPRVHAPPAASQVPPGDRVGERRDQGGRARPREAARGRQARRGARARAQQPRGRRRARASRRCASTSASGRPPSPRSPGPALRRSSWPPSPRFGARATEADGARASPSTRSPRATASRSSSTTLGRRGLSDAYEIAAALTDGAARGRVGRPGRGGPSATSRSPRASASSRPARARASCWPSCEGATARIADLVGAVRSYSYLDQAPRQTVDIHEGLESTLALLAHKLRAKHVEIVRDLDPELPPASRRPAPSSTRSGRT